MDEAAQENPGSMLSIIGLELEAVKEICAQANTEIANINCPGQTVISGAVPAIRQAEEAAKDKGAKFAVPLEVSAAFHSSFMKSASQKFAAEIEKIKLNSPVFSVIKNVDALPAKSAEEIKDSLTRQISSSVLWESSMRYILAQGINKFFEFGPGRVLKGLMRRIDSSAEVVNIEKKEDLLSLTGEG